MNTDFFLLFFNAVLSVVYAAIIVMRILKKEKLELSVLRELKSNLLADLKDFQSEMKVYGAATKSSAVIIDFIDGKIDYHESLNILFGKIPVQEVFASNKAP